MSKLIIWVGGKPLLNGYRIREFSWSEKHKCYIYGGQEINDADFNSKYEKAFRNNLDLNPRVRVIESSAKVEPISKVATISVAREITVEEAEAVMARMAPDRLKKKAGRPPRMMEVA